ncbi:MAG: hypothetical protein LR015_14370 [Verrucomicrobia bacterium]|nr:hypothetical protein [Verrucomicrobiota bacterium]
MIALPGFGVSLSVGSSGELMWPEWLPISIDSLALVWNDFNTDRLDFRIILSASVSSLNALPINVEGVIQDVVIDIGLLRQGLFPIVDIGTVAISVSGNLLGGEASGALVLGIVRFDADGNRVEAGSETPVVGRVLYGAIQAGFSFAGLAGFQIRIGISELGPLQVYLNADIPILLEPITGLSIGNFRAGVTFNSVLPSIDDPFDLRQGVFSPMGDISLPDWIALLEESVVNQYNSPVAGDFWAVFTQPMRIEGGASLFSLYTSQLVFRADIDIILSTDGKFLINARGVFADNLSLGFKLYADLSRIADGSGTILFLADLPAELPFMTIFGGLTFEFFREDGLEVNETNLADGFRIRLSGGVIYSAASFLDLTISGHVDIAFTPTLFSIDLVGSLNVTYLGDLIGVAGMFRIDTSGETPQIWGVLAMQPNFEILEQLGLYTEGLAVLRLNATGIERTETLDIPGTGERTFVLRAESFSLLVEGFLRFELMGEDWFRMDGTFAMEITPEGLDVVVQAMVLLGPSSPGQTPFVTFELEGFFAIRASGMAGKFEIALDTAFSPEVGITLRGSALIMFNTTSQTVSYELPQGLEGVEAGDRTVIIPGAPPNGPPANQPYFLVDVSGEIGLLDILQMDGSFYLLLSPSVIEMEVTANFGLSIAGDELYRFSALGALRIDSRGAAGVLDLELLAGNDSFGLSLEAVFRLEFNTMANAITLGGIALQPGSYLEIVADGSLTIAGLRMEGSFFFRQAAGTITIIVSATTQVSVSGSVLFRFNVSGGLSVNTAGAAGFLNMSITATPSFMSLTGTVQLQVNTRASSVTIGNQTIPAGPGYLRILVSGNLTVQGVIFSGSFNMELSPSFLRLEMSAAFEIRASGTVILRFQASGNLFIDNFGIAAVISLGSPLANNAASLGFNLPSAGFTLQINTRATAVNLGGVSLPGGPFVQLTLNASISILGVNFAGSFLFRQQGANVTIAAQATFTLQSGGVTFLTFNIDGELTVSSVGLRAALDVSLASGAPGTFGISVSGTFQLVINTSNSLAVVGGRIVPGNYFAILATGNLSIGGFSFVSGSFSFVKAGNQYDLNISTQLVLSVSGTNLFRFNVNAAVRVASNGVAGSFAVSLASQNTSAYGFQLSASFLMEINTTGSQQNIGGTIVQAGNYTRVIATGLMTVAGSTSMVRSPLQLPQPP